MLIGGIVAAVVIVGVVAGVALRRRSHDDVHSVAHYHRQLHTLQEIRTHPLADAEDGADNGASYPASAFRVSTSSAVRLTDPGGAIVPPVAPPPVRGPGEPVAFDDDAPPEGGPEVDQAVDTAVDTAVESNGHPEHAPSSFMTGVADPAMHSIDRRPRRLAGPLVAIAAVVVLVAVLIATGLHSNNPSHRGGHATATTVTTPHGTQGAHGAQGTHAGTHASGRTHQATTTTTTAPAVSAPANTSAHAATYQVADASYSLALAAKTGECWVSATDTSTNKVLYVGLLTSGQSQTVAATGPVSVIAGAPDAFSATVDGAAVVLPSGAEAPFTLTFQPPGGTGNTGASGGAAGTAGTPGTASG